MGPSNSRLSLTQIATILAVGLATRLAILAFVFHQFSAAWFFNRGTEMGFLAQSILQGKGLSSPFGGSTGPTAFIAPAYPLFVALIFKLFGSYTFASALVIMLIHIALNLLTIYLIMQVTLWLSNKRWAAILAGLYWAVALPVIWIPTIFWETSFSCLIVAASIAFAVRTQRAPGNSGFLLIGTSIAIAALINPAMLPMLLAILCWVAYRFRKERRHGILLALLALVVVFSPWPIRNARIFHAFIPLRSTVGFEMWMGNRPQSMGYLDESLFPTFNRTELNEYVRMGEVPYVAMKSSEAKQYIYSHPGTFFTLSLRRFARFWTGSGTQHGSPIFVLHACISTLLGLMGIVFLARRRPALALLCALPLLIFPLPYYITHAEFRYRLNIDPLLTILAAYAVSVLFDRQEKLQCKP
jgi:4-amino-4-deoxy-L-arabinose transferase-like glycosyltransferase